MNPEPISVVHAGELELEDDPIPGERILEGAPRATDAELARWSNGTVTGVWRCQPGSFRDVELAETFVVLEGRATVEAEGVRHGLGPGDVCTFAAGAATTWTIHEPLLKVYALVEIG